MAGQVKVPELQSVRRLGVGVQGISRSSYGSLSS